MRTVKSPSDTAVRGSKLEPFQRRKDGRGVVLKREELHTQPALRSSVAGKGR